MEIGVIARAQANRIKARIDEPDRRIAIGNRLLIDQSQVSGPHGRRKTGSTIIVGRAGSLIGADVKREIRVCRNVRAVAIRLRTGGTSTGRRGLPGWNRKTVRRNAAAAVNPSSFRTPGTGGAASLQVGAADRRDVHIIRRENCGGRLPLSAVTGRLKQILTLRRELLEVGVVGVGIGRAPRPGRAQLQGQRRI